MLRPKNLRAVLTLPAALAFAFVTLAGSAHAAVSDQVIALNGKLGVFGAQEGKTVLAQAAYTTTTATADDLVFAVYELVKQTGGDPTITADIVQAALTATSAGKVRADKDVVIGRLVESALVATLTSTGAAPLNEGAVVDAILGRLGPTGLNTGLAPAKQLTLAGKEKAVAYALKATTGHGAAIATDAAALYTPAGATTAAMDTARTAFNVAVLKQLAFKPITEDPANAAATKGTYFPVLNGAELTVVGQPPFVEGAPPANFSVEDYVDKALDSYASLPKATAALNIAAGVSATVPSVAGAAIGGYVKDLKTAGGAAAADSAILAYLKGTPSAPASAGPPAVAAKPAVPGIVTNAKLANSVSDIVADVFKQLAAGSHSNDVIALATSSKASTGVSAITISTALKGKIASGAIRAVPNDATSIVNGILALKNPVTGKDEFAQTAIAAFAQAAAVGNSGAAPDIAVASIKAITYVLPTAATPTDTQKAAAIKADKTKIQAVAIGVMKSVALVDANGAEGVAQTLVGITRTNGATTYSPYSAKGTASAPNTDRQQLAADLAKGLATNYSAAGSAVAGVVHASLTIDSPLAGGTVYTAATTFDEVARLIAPAVKAAPKATLAIALKVASDTAIAFAYFNGAGTSSDLASKIAARPEIASTNAGAVAAGVSIADTANADKIVAAVINSGTGTLLNAHQAAALTIANTVAINVDVEAIGLIAKAVGGLLQPVKNPDGTTNTSKLPKVTSVGTLATSLAKAINTKPLVVWNNRVDELNELAAELTKQYLSRSGLDGSPTGSTTATDPTELKALVTALSSIGTSIFKSTSAKLLANTFNNAADVSDIAGGVAGAIAQAIASSSNVTAAAKTALLATTMAAGTLEKNLITAATASKSSNQVTAAFSNVAAHGASSGYETGANYEVGTVTDPETRIKNI